jgi:hypothetical protein
MHRVLVVRSVHYPTGRASVGALDWLLGRLKPEVLFLEHAPSSHRRFMSRSFPTLESAAVLRFIETSAPLLVPVDAEIDPTAIKADSDALFEKIAALSPRFQRLDMLNAEHTSEGGFAYLNSPASASLQLKIEREILATVEAADDPSLVELLRKWNALHETREEAMIRGVEAFAEEHSFLKAVLLVGAAHAPSLHRRSIGRASATAPAVRWEFDWPAIEDLSG